MTVLWAFRLLSRIWLLILAFAKVGAASLPLSNEVPYHRDYLYVGGHYADDGSGKGQHIFKDQMYVERLVPMNGTTKPFPIVFIHGQANTGTNLLNKPDGGSGWASFYTSRGYTMYIIDQTFRGRSPWMPGNGTLATYSAEVIQQRFTAPEVYNMWPQAHLHTQWPGSGVMGDVIFDAYYASNVQFLENAAYQESTVQAAGAALLDRIGKPVILMSHSQGGVMPWLIADVRPRLVRAIVSLEPTGPPFQEAVFSTKPARPYGLTDHPLTYSPPVTNAAVDLVRQTIVPETKDEVSCILQASSPTPRQLIYLRDITVLVLTTEASYHATYDFCTVEYLRQAGVHTEHLSLPDRGVHGNGHLVFLERNSNEVAGLLMKWIENINNASHAQRLA